MTLEEKVAQLRSDIELSVENQLSQGSVFNPESQGVIRSAITAALEDTLKDAVVTAENTDFWGRLARGEIQAPEYIDINTDDINVTFVRG